jgi:hypothetical protein
MVVLLHVVTVSVLLVDRAVLAVFTVLELS